ncbi:hypothetical protein QBC43DRAFT_371500 [Cladorrhinum sp. PSN259]|nr:hypothetical protein QBC43DRAFT_371500 [Cladorrhinum sp. PSN259]
MSRKLDLDIGDEFDEYEKQLKDAVATRGRLMKANELRDQKRKALRKAVALSIDKVQARIKKRVEKFTSEQRTRQVVKEVTFARRIRKLMGQHDEKFSQMVKFLLDGRQHAINFALQFHTVHKNNCEELTMALKIKDPVVKEAVEAKKPAQEEQDDIDIQDLFDFAMKIVQPQQQQNAEVATGEAAVEEQSRLKPTASSIKSVRGKRPGDVEGKRPAAKSVTIPENPVTAAHFVDYTPKKRKRDSYLLDLKRAENDMTNLTDKQRFRTAAKRKEVETIVLDSSSSVSPDFAPTVGLKSAMKRTRRHEL